MSPNAPRVTKHCFSISLDHIVYRKVEKIAIENGVSVNNQIAELLRNAVYNVRLTAEAEEIIDERIYAEVGRRIKRKARAKAKKSHK